MKSNWLHQASCKIWLESQSPPITNRPLLFLQPRTHQLSAPLTLSLQIHLLMSMRWFLDDQSPSLCLWRQPTEFIRIMATSCADMSTEFCYSLYHFFLNLPVFSFLFHVILNGFDTNKFMIIKICLTKRTWEKMMWQENEIQQKNKKKELPLCIFHCVLNTQKIEVRTSGKLQECEKLSLSIAFVIYPLILCYFDVIWLSCRIVVIMRPLQIIRLPNYTQIWFLQHWIK